ncbi:CHAT domain-containing protein, partial [Solirubrobacter soli]|uniref:CHAT domain-containing protein n=1 Tax=Solirubrobacter soli TaxID=363832 RepID=UPI00056D517C
MSDWRVPGHLGRILDLDGAPAGTCFQLVTGVVATAWHVLAAVGAGEVGASVVVDPLRGGPERVGEVVAVDPVADLAVVRLDVPLEGSVSRIAATDEARMTEAVVITGVSRVEDPGHEHRYLDAAGTWAGGTLRDEQLPLGRVRSQDVLPGMSGAPVRRADGDAVLGVVSGRYNSTDGWLRDSVWVARCERLAALCTGVAEVDVERAAAKGPVDVVLEVDDRRVRLVSGGIDVTAEHRGVGFGLSDAVDEIRRARVRAGLAREPIPAVADAPGSVALDRASELLGKSFLPGEVSSALTRRLEESEAAHEALRIGVRCTGVLARLPWEALPDRRSQEPLALRPLVNVHRRAAAATPGSVPGPLRILIAISSPERGGGAVLDYERELRNVLKAVRAARQGNAHVRVLPFATTTEIHAALSREPVHVLHLSGHGSPGSFVFEDDTGAALELDADTFVDRAIPAGAMPAVFALAACYTNVATATDLPSFAGRLLQRGAAVVIASETAVTDLYATRVFARIYGQLADAAVPDIVAAVCDARRLVQRELEAADDPRDRALAVLSEWASLSVLAAQGSVSVFDPDVSVAPAPPPPRFAIGRVAARGVGEFVGRRHEQRRWPIELLAEAHGGLVLHGIGGIGKTTLAAELASRVMARDPEALIVAVDGELSVEQVLAALIGALRRRLILTERLTGYAAQAITHASRSDLGWADRLGLLRDAELTRLPLVLVLDNFEDNLSREAQRAAVREPTLAALLAAIVHDPGAWRLLITSRYEFELPASADRALEFRGLGPLSAAETRKLVWSLPALDALEDAEVDRVWRMVGGHPRALEYLDALLSHGAGRYADITTRLTNALRDQLGEAETTALLAAEWELDDALAQVATIAADDVLLDELLDTLATVPGAEELLIGASVYREPIDINALLFQAGTPDPSAEHVPDSQAAERAILAILQASGIATDAPVDPSTLSSDIQDALKPHLDEIQRLPIPPLRTPDRFGELMHACHTSTLLSIQTDDGSPVAFVHRWTASELERRLAETGRDEVVLGAHRRAAEYWRWRVKVWPQDLRADVHDLLEGRHHLLAAGQADAAAALTEDVCLRLDTWGAWDEEAALIRDTLARIDPSSERAAAWTHQLGLVAQARGDLAEAETLYRRSLEI